MSEIILEINEVENVKLDSSYIKYDGYEIITNKQTAHLLIANGTSYCEKWGYICSEDNFDEFIESEIINVYKTDVAFNNVKVYLEDNYLKIDDCVFVNIETTKGLLQFVIYNGHNGYYGHSIIIKSNQVQINGVL